MKRVSLVVLLYIIWRLLLPSTSSVCLAASRTSSLSARQRYTNWSMLSLAWNKSRMNTVTNAFCIIHPKQSAYRQVFKCHLYQIRTAALDNSINSAPVCTLRQANALHPHTLLSTFSSSSSSRQLTKAWEGQDAQNVSRLWYSRH